MNYNSNTNQWRTQFSEAASALYIERERVFRRGQPEMLRRIRAGGLEGLRDLALELRARGVYSRKIAPSAIEHAILCRLHAVDETERTWRQFIAGTVGLAWFKPRRPGRQKTQ